MGIFLDNFKTDILGSLSEQLDNLKIQNKKKTKNDALSIFCPKCRKKHALRECPLHSLEFCVICAKNHNTKEWHSIPGLKVVFQDEVGASQVESLFFIAKTPWKNKKSNKTQGLNNQSYAQAQNNWTASVPWQPWPPQSPNPSSAQGWKNHYRKYPQYP